MSVIVTGGSGDIGAACARLLAARGADVMIVDSDGGAADPLASEINEGTAGHALARTADVAVAEDVRGYVATAVDAWGIIAGVVHAAGVAGPAAPLPEFDEGVFLLSEAAGFITGAVLPVDGGLVVSPS